MLTAIYAIISMQLLVLLITVYLVLHRWASNLLSKYAERRKRRFAPHVLGLLIYPAGMGPLARGLLIGDRAFIKQLLLLQAAQLKGEDRANMTAVFEALGYPKREMRALGSRRWWRRLESAINLGIMRSRQATNALVSAVGDPIEEVRLAAVQALGELNDAAGLRVLLDAMEDGDRWTGSRIVETLFGIGPSIGPEIVPRLESATDVRVRRLYAQLCGLLRLPAALGPLIPLLEDSDEETRVVAAEALGNIGDVSAVESLIMSLDDESWEVRARAALSLGAIGDKQALGELDHRLSDCNWWVRHNAASALHQIGGDGVEALRRATGSDEPARGRAAAQVLAERALGV